MQFLIQSLVIALALAFNFACSGNIPALRSASSDNSREANAEAGKQPGSENLNPPGYETGAVPIPVNGTNLTDLSCVITNDGIEDVEDTVATCRIQTARGTKFGGKLENVSASVFVKSSTGSFIGKVAILDNSQPDSFTVVFEGVKPSDALGVKAAADLDGHGEEWITQLRRNIASMTTEPMELYVDSDWSSSGVLCTKAAPCTSISRALLMVPEILRHSVSVHVAAGDYSEQVRVTGRTISSLNARLAIVGEDKGWTPGSSGIFRLTGKPSDSDRQGLVIANNPGNQIVVANVDVQGCFKSNIMIYKSDVYLGNTAISDCGPDAKPNTGLSIQGSRVIIGPKGLTIRGQAVLLWKGVHLDAESDLNIQGSVLIEQSLAPVNGIGIQISGGSRVTLAGKESIEVKIIRATYGIHLSGDSVMQDIRGAFGISALNQPRVKLGQVAIGLLVESSQVRLVRSNFSIDDCSGHCIYAGSNGDITFGEFAAVTPTTVRPSIRMNSTPSIQATQSVNLSSYLIRTLPNAKVSIYHTVGSLDLCHNPLSSFRPFLAEQGSKIFIGADPSVLSAVTHNCADIDGSLGKVDLQLGSLSVSQSRSTEALCTVDEIFETCVARSFALLPP